MNLIVFILIFALSLIAVYFAFKAKNSAVEEFKDILSLRANGTLLLAIGFTVHNTGDYLGAFYGGSFELALESIAHLIILIAFVLFYKSVSSTAKTTKGYWFK